ncbi:SsrA-binding protein SmpB [Dolosicoccus paucivorans]|uniref:SsrA-binding protein n=1 Tax=Dolosicoccus paucivorans TaxID=84521 RepID=A0A2N6SQ78_9LACT|nr:SsrA-binding protein SmpB [Dolosicoccus paucivorans]PMB84671.1 SsrA-binding protein [Dolosicoccus paucivorans]PMC59225.1 SsrA-binding protein [Dolosicoccus paucivorans]
MSRSRALAQNRKARHDYEILDTLEAGMVLKGTEIKSIRNGRLNLKDGYVSIRDNEAWLMNVHISPYEQGNMFNHDPVRPRKLLLHKRQIIAWRDEAQQKQMTIVPLEVYLKNGRAKVKIGLVRGKKLYDKRHALKEQQMKRDIDRALKMR